MVYDLIDYHLKECVKRETRMKVCKTADGILPLWTFQSGVLRPGL